jgi:hypothetical protein
VCKRMCGSGSVCVGMCEHVHEYMWECAWECEWVHVRV